MIFDTSSICAICASYTRLFESFRLPLPCILVNFKNITRMTFTPSISDI